MKKTFIILIVVIMCLCMTSVFAETSAQCDIALCYDEEVYSVDYVFDVSEGVEIYSVSVVDNNCMYDWNYVESEARLYISLASGKAIAKSKTAVVVNLSSNAESLQIVSMTVNGNVGNNVYPYHTPCPMEEIPPSFDTTGFEGGEICENCNVVLREHQQVEATGPIVSAVLNEENTLVVSGGLSDKKEADGTTFLAVYNKDKKMLTMKIITEYDHSNFSIPLQDMKDAHIVKIFRLAETSLGPLYDVVETDVKGEYCNW